MNSILWQNKNKPKGNAEHCTLAVSSESVIFSLGVEDSCWGWSMGKKILEKASMIKKFSEECWWHFRQNKREMLPMYVCCHFQWANKYMVTINLIKNPLKSLTELLVDFYNYIFFSQLLDIDSIPESSWKCCKLKRDPLKWRVWESTTLDINACFSCKNQTFCYKKWS